MRWLHVAHSSFFVWLVAGSVQLIMAEELQALTDGRHTKRAWQRMYFGFLGMLRGMPQIYVHSLGISEVQ